MLDEKKRDIRIGLTKSDELTLKEAQEDSAVTWHTAVDGEDIWMGRIEVKQDAKSLLQHHEDSETVHYVLKGKVKVVYGNKQEESVELDRGDFIYIPPYSTYSFENVTPSEELVMITFMASSFQITYEENSDVHEKASNEQVKVVRASELDESTDQTKNMPRRTGIESSKIWIGRVTGEEGMDSGAHHHGEAETGGFIISGITRILHGEGYADYTELTIGDYVHVPPFIPHIERNMSETETVEFLTARNPRNIVVNLKNPENI